MAQQNDRAQGTEVDQQELATPLSSSAVPLNPVYQVFFNDYLRYPIFEFLYNDSERIDVSNPDMVALALTCSTFYEDAMKILWKKVPFQALLSSLDDDVFKVRTLLNNSFLGPYTSLIVSGLHRRGAPFVNA